MVEIQISTSELTNTQIFYSELVDSLYKKNFSMALRCAQKGHLAIE
jgi:hypothetical protein